MKIVGLTGNIAGGKGLIAELLKQKGFEYFSLSNQLRTIAKNRGTEIVRSSLQDLGNEMRTNFSPDILARLVGADIFASDCDGAVIDGIRNPGEVEYFRKTKNFLLIAVVAKKEKRFEWMRARNRESDPKTWEEFLKMDARDLGEGEAASGQQVGACIEMADFILPNLSGKEGLEFKAGLIVQNWWR